MKTHFKQYTVTDNADAGSTFTVAAPSAKKALEQMGSGGAYTAQEPPELIPYTHAPTVAAVVAALGAGWDAAPAWEDNAASPYKLHGPGGVVLWMHGPAYRHPKAWNISAETGTQSDKGERVNVKGPDSINISTEKAPEVIARDIVRRLLPAATVCAAELEVARVRANTAESGQAETVAALARIAGRVARGATVYVGPLTFEVGYSGDSVSLKGYSVSAAVALKIAELVRGEE